jgi:curved DNA-binding protein CbpA
MILTQEYSRVAAYRISVDDALRLLGIQGTGSFEGDKKLIRDLAKKYHPDVNQSKDATQKMEAVNILRDIYIRNGQQLPRRSAPRQESPRTQQTYQAPGRGSGPLSVTDMSSMIQQGYTLAGDFLNLCNSWLSDRGDCQSIKEDLRSSLFKDFDQVMKSINTGPNRKTHPNFTRVLDSFELVYDNFLRLVAYCRANSGRDNQVSGYISNLKTRIEQLLQYGSNR